MVNSSAMQETQKTWVQPPRQENSLKKGPATHSSTPAGKIPWTEVPGRLWFMRLQSWTRLKQLSMHAWDNVKVCHSMITGTSEGEEREKGIENVFEEIMAESFPNLKKETDIQTQKTQKFLNKMNTDLYQDIL